MAIGVGVHAFINTVENLMRASSIADAAAGASYIAMILAVNVARPLDPAIRSAQRSL